MALSVRRPATFSFSPLSRSILPFAHPMQAIPKARSTPCKGCWSALHPGSGVGRVLAHRWTSDKGDANERTTRADDAHRIHWCARLLARASTAGVPRRPSGCAAPVHSALQLVLPPDLRQRRHRLHGRAL